MQLFSGKEYLKIDIANNFGLDKMNWDHRLDWFNDNEAHLEELTSEADAPALYYAGVKAYRDVQAGKPTGYMISLDATSSGLQLLAALTGDRSAAELCNVVDTGHRRDAYMGVYEHMLSQTDETAKISRDHCKDAIMTALYGSTAMPKQVFGDGTLLNLFHTTMEELAPAAWDLNKTFLALWDPEATEHSWVLPDNFHVHIKVMAQVKKVVHFLNQPFDVFYNENLPIENGRSLSANNIHSVDGMIVREVTRRCDYDPTNIINIRTMIDDQPCHWRKFTGTADDQMVMILWGHYHRSGYLSARILDHLSYANAGHVDVEVIRDLIDSLPPKPFKVVSVHDCFRCLPNYGNDLRIQYNNQLMLIAKSNLLASLLSQIIGQTAIIGKLDENLWKDIAQSNYALS